MQSFICDQCSKRFDERPGKKAVEVERLLSQNDLDDPSILQLHLDYVVRHGGEAWPSDSPDLCDTCLASVLYEALDKLGLKRPEEVPG